MPRLTKIYTRKGDKGKTTLQGHAISKGDLLVEVVGTIDELNAVIGLITTQQLNNSDIEHLFTRIQNDLFDFGGELHLPERIAITPEKITWLETTLDKWNAGLPALQEFVLPAGNSASATTHIARTVCRRAERCLVRLDDEAKLTNPEMLKYLNRLSDLLFVIARVLMREDNLPEVMWEH